MTNPHKRREIDRLLTEVDAVTGTPLQRRAAQPPAETESRGSALLRQLRPAGFAASAAAATIWVLFALVPFLGATSGAAGAFLSAFVAVLVFGRR